MTSLDHLTSEQFAAVLSTALELTDLRYHTNQAGEVRRLTNLELLLHAAYELGYLPTPAGY